MMTIKKLSSKICLVGDGGVGKTSLIRRYVHDIFKDKYITTIGTKVTRKELIFDYPEKNVQVQLNAMIWDIMGQKAFRGLFRGSYFNGTNGIIGVCSLIDKDSLWSLVEWVNSIHKKVNSVPIILLANKSDLGNDYQFGEEDLRTVANKLNASFIYTSARTGENVPDAFLKIGKEMVKSQLDLT